MELYPKTKVSHEADGIILYAMHYSTLLNGLQYFAERTLVRCRAYSGTLLNVLQYVAECTDGVLRRLPERFLKLEETTKI